MKKQQDLSSLQFIFTQDSFILDDVQPASNEQVMKYRKNFKDHKYHALYEMGFQELHGLSLSASFLHMVAESFLDELLRHSELEIARDQVYVEVNDDIAGKLLKAVPFAIGSEYIDALWIQKLFDHLKAVFADEIKQYQGSVQLYLAEKSQHLQVAQRIFFHLVDHPEDEHYPFAFLATYATKDSAGHIRHMPLKHALIEYQTDRIKLIGLLSCLNKAAEISELISQFMETGEMFHPIKLKVQEAYQLLKQVPQIEACGILCRVPNWWKKKYSSVSMQVSIGDKEPKLLGFDSILSMTPSLLINGERLSEEEIRQLLQEEEGLVWLKGQWVEVDHKRLLELLERFKHYDGTVTMKEALRIQMGGEESQEEEDGITNGEWLRELLHNLRTPSKLKKKKLPKQFDATLRPYQMNGYQWLHYMNSLGFGACLADDMGLGKTIQVLAYLEELYERQKDAKILLVVPASLLGNWSKEIEKFAPKMEYHILHGKSAPLLSQELQKHVSFLTITTYGMASRVEPLKQISWTCVILDEAQAIKNPATKQTKAIKELPSSMRIAMTGTPIENDLVNLWSLFDFLNKGLLGSYQEFQIFARRVMENPEYSMKLRNMVSPFILRRLKTDKTIISDLPEKVEMVDHVQLTKRQIVLYRKLLSDVEDKLAESTGMERRGLILSTISKMKQICNHPDQFTHDINYLPKESGKFAMLKELCETIFEKRERVLVFTQYREICDYLADYLETIFHKRGFVLHGGTPIKERNYIVDAFNSEEYIPYIVLSVKAAGTGLNLTSANHVIHFDRWWNPAVENQASDRAYRIGQKKNVFVHKFVSEGTVEEKIDQMINSKKALADNIIAAGKESWITELNNEELMSLLRLEV